VIKSRPRAITGKCGLEKKAARKIGWLRRGGGKRQTGENQLACVSSSQEGKRFIPGGAEGWTKEATISSDMIKKRQGVNHEQLGPNQRGSKLY